MNETEATARAAAVVGPIAQVEQVQGFAGNRTFRLRALSGETFYLKSGATIQAEARACELARSAGVPAPEILAAETTYLICAEVPGSPSSDDAVITEAGRGLRRLHGIRGDDGRWADRLSTPIERLDLLAGIVPDDLVRRLRVALPPFVDTVADAETVLLHSDLHPRHLYAVGNELTGVIDWGDAMYGDPLFDLARFSMAGDAALDAFLSGYGLNGVGLERTLSMYRILWSLMALHAERAAGGDWFAAHVDTITKELS
ncbi:phosphotransferase family protein [Kribbella antiqua]|uniref:phosphotransferase family protein n=1 Tax=Kribbella antiqua TaxID=2512217 RepID=UPI00130544FC|nr:aminoglycoside phosphotransferase family protein [Kribbella antiqua]